MLLGYGTMLILLFMPLLKGAVISHVLAGSLGTLEGDINLFEPEPNLRVILVALLLC
jgi:hypothetical protein